MSTQAAATQTGNLRSTLLSNAIDLVRATGPDGLSLREVQRRSNVSPAAAYRHFRDRQALLVAVGWHASSLLADRIGQAHAAVPDGPDRAVVALARLRDGCRAYVEFALDEPGLFRSLLLTDEGPDALTRPEASARAGSGLGPFELLQACLRDLASSGEAPAAMTPGTDTAVWAACHGLAVLMLDGPLRELDPPHLAALITRLSDIVIDGVRTPALQAHRDPGPEPVNVAEER